MDELLKTLERVASKLDQLVGKIQEAQNLAKTIEDKADELLS